MFPLVRSVMERTRAYGMGVASDVASRGMGIVRPYGLGPFLQNRPRILHMGISSGAASAGQEGSLHVY